MRTIQVTFDYKDFNTSTRRDTDTRRHALAEVREASGGGVYIWGSLGCGKTRDNVREALIAYLGGRQLLAHRVFD
tara:strand:+ start:903 stop:1127 length:225 start_codon:yes stop_codon:yes gene_type:complete